MDGEKTIITLLPPSPSTALPLLLLQLAAVSPLVVLSSPSQLATSLTSTDTPPPAVVVVHVDLLDEVVEQVWEDKQGQTGVLVIGDPQKKRADIVKAAGARGMALKHWEEIWDIAETANMDIPRKLTPWHPLRRSRQNRHTATSTLSSTRTKGTRTPWRKSPILYVYPSDSLSIRGLTAERHRGRRGLTFHLPSGQASLFCS